MWDWTGLVFFKPKSPAAILLSAAEVKVRVVKVSKSNLVFFQEKVTIELIQILEEEERRWAQTLHIEDYQSNLARSVIQVHHSFIYS